MTPKEEARQIYAEIDKIEFTEKLEFETGFGDVEIDLPDWVIKKVAILMIDRMTHVEGSITQRYWEEVKKEISLL